MEYSRFKFVVFFVGDEMLVFYRLQTLFDWCTNLHNSSFFLLNYWLIIFTTKYTVLTVVLLLLRSQEYIPFDCL
jgi:hypothetical protein